MSVVTLDSDSVRFKSIWGQPILETARAEHSLKRHVYLCVFFDLFSKVFDHHVANVARPTFEVEHVSTSMHLCILPLTKIQLASETAHGVRIGVTPMSSKKADTCNFSEVQLASAKCADSQLLSGLLCCTRPDTEHCHASELGNSATASPAIGLACPMRTELPTACHTPLGARCNTVSQESVKYRTSQRRTARTSFTLVRFTAKKVLPLKAVEQTSCQCAVVFRLFSVQ